MTLEEIKGRTYSNQEEFWRDVETVVAQRDRQLREAIDASTNWYWRYKHVKAHWRASQAHARRWKALAKRDHKLLGECLDGLCQEQERSWANHDWARRWKAYAKATREQFYALLYDIDEYVERRII